MCVRIHDDARGLAISTLRRGRTHYTVLQTAYVQYMSIKAWRFIRSSIHVPRGYHTHTHTLTPSHPPTHPPRLSYQQT